MRKFILYLVTPLIICYSCEKSDIDAGEQGDGKTTVEFVTTVSGSLFNAGNGGYTRAYDSHWTAGDQVGIYMFESNDAGPGGTTYLAENRKYTADVNGRLTTDRTNLIMLEEDVTKVDFMAYYPYRGTLSGSSPVYKVDITDQSEQEAIDLLYAVTTDGYDSDNMPVQLSFSHKLTKLVFNVESDVRITSFSAVIKDIVVTADFKMESDELEFLTNGDVAMYSVYEGTKAAVEAVVIPMGLVAGTEIEFTVNGKSAVWTIPSGTEWNEGAKTTYKVNVTGGDTEVVENYGWFETPLKTSIENTVFLTYDLPEPDRAATMRNYSMLYDTRYMIAYWVAYPMCPYYRVGASDDTNYSGSWSYDNIFASSLQPNVRTKSWPDLAGVSYDRGHQIPSADRRYSYAVNKSTYYVTNQTAQNATLNRNTWMHLEDRIRDWMYECDTIYVVTGAHLTSETDQTVKYIKDNSDKDVALPKYYYKALAKVTFDENDQIKECYTAAYKMDNVPITGTNFNNYRLTVKELEEMTGFTFFPQLSDEVKSTVVPSQWTL